MHLDAVMSRCMIAAGKVNVCTSIRDVYAEFLTSTGDFEVELVGLDIKSLEDRGAMKDAELSVSGRRWQLHVLQLLGYGSWGLVYLVEVLQHPAAVPEGTAEEGLVGGSVMGGASGSCTGCTGSGAAAGAAAGAGAVQAADNNSKSSSGFKARPSNAAYPRLMALKLATPLEVQVALNPTNLYRLKEFYGRQTRNDFAKEASILGKASQGEVNNHVLCLYDHGEVVLFGEARACLLMEYADIGSLDAVVSQLYPGRLDAHSAQVLVGKAAGSLWAFQDTAKCIHRDIKGGNLFVCGDQSRPVEEWRVKIGDCGLGKQLQSIGDFGRTYKMGTECYRAPEANSISGIQDFRFDTYSLGCLYLGVRFGFSPFLYLAEWKEDGRISQEEFDVRWSDQAAELDNPETPYGEEGALSAEEKRFVKRCLTKDVGLRPFPRQLVYDRFIRKYAH
jgi:serine/threonine protein kinase